MLFLQGIIMTKKRSFLSNKAKRNQARKMTMDILNHQAKNIRHTNPQKLIRKQVVLSTKKQSNGEHLQR